jgi:hypothetical protein
LLLLQQWTNGRIILQSSFPVLHHEH